MFGRELRLPLELVLPTPDNNPEEVPEDVETIHSQFTNQMRRSMRHVFDLARANLNQANRLQKHQYDRNSHDRQLALGQGVWLYNPKRRKGRSPKLYIPWEGSYTVVEVRRGVLVTIQKNRHTKPHVVHIDKLAPVRKQFDGSWIHTLARKGRVMVPELFRSAEEEAAKTSGAPSSASLGPTVTPVEPKRRQTGTLRARRGGRFIGVRVGHRPVTRSQRAVIARDPG
jgi:hypothetical protein